jgi:hypothetical protein
MTLTRRLWTALMALSLAVLLGFGGDAFVRISEAVDPDPSAVETISLTQEHSVIRVAPRARFHTKIETVASAWRETGCARGIPARGQVACALPDGGRPSAARPTGPPFGRV